jgi:hypothetical protein
MTAQRARADIFGAEVTWMGRAARRKASRKLNAIRVYCCIEPGTTGDHVPPKSLFPKPRVGLIEVPCCDLSAL